MKCAANQGRKHQSIKDHNQIRFSFRHYDHLRISVILRTSTCSPHEIPGCKASEFKRTGNDEIIPLHRFPVNFFELSTEGEIIH